MAIVSIDNTNTVRNVLNQLVDFVAEDVSGSMTRKKYQVFVTGGYTAPGVTSSLFQTVFDQNYSLQTSNEIFDLTMGIWDQSTIVTRAKTGIDSNLKKLYPSHSLMMREKTQMYSQFAQLLLGDADAQFTAPFSNYTSNQDEIDAALFIPFKRLFTRDGIKRETFAMRFFQSASDTAISNRENITCTSTFPASGSVIFTDVGAGASIENSAVGGEVGNIVNSSNTNETVGLLFYQKGVAVFDLEKITSSSQHMSGAIDAVHTVTAGHPGAGRYVMGSALSAGRPPANAKAKFIPDFIVSASMDNILDHISTVRFGSGSETFLTFQNNTFIHSTLYYCRAQPQDFNYSSNPTYTDTNGRIVVIDSGQEGIQKSFTFITTVGLYDADEQLLAFAKLSRPVLKNDEKDLTFRVRLDF